VLGWRFGLGLQLGPMRTPTHVLGWEIAGRTADGMLLGVRSPLLDARLIVKAHAGTVLHLTLIRYRRTLTSVVWAAAAPIHERVIPYLLAAAARRHQSHALVHSGPTE
jgi:hypothetical protein